MPFAGHLVSGRMSTAIVAAAPRPHRKREARSKCACGFAARCWSSHAGKPRKESPPCRISAPPRKYGDREARVRRPAFSRRTLMVPMPSSGNNACAILSRSLPWIAIKRSARGPTTTSRLASRARSGKLSIDTATYAPAKLIAQPPAERLLRHLTACESLRRACTPVSSCAADCYARQPAWPWRPGLSRRASGTESSEQRLCRRASSRTVRLRL